MFASRLHVFDPISGQPTDADLAQLRKKLTTILLPLPYDVENGIHNLMVLVMDEDDYQQRYRAKFPTPTKPAVYDETILNNAMNVVQVKAEAVYMKKLWITYSLSPPKAKTVTLLPR